MPAIKKILTNEEIERYLQGSDPQEYIIAVEPEYNTPTVNIIVNNPTSGKRIEKHTYQPFLWFNEKITQMMYDGKRSKILEACKNYDVRITRLRVDNEDGYVPPRMENGYKFMAKCKGTYNDLINFFKEGGIDVFDKENIRSFVLFSPAEQFMIQTGKRLFKGMDDYDDLHRLQFDLETEGLFASKHAIFQVGVRDNRGMEHVLEVDGDTPQAKRNAERDTIANFFKVIDIVQPDIITGYNSENFDWPYLFERADRLGMKISDLAITLNRISKIKRKPATLKLGGETEAYNQTHMYGYNIIDISHAVRRAMAINSEIKGWGLKYITQYSGIAKPNRVYVQGDKINSTWKDTDNEYAFNNDNGDWYKITEKNILKSGYKKVTGAYIVQRYLCDDLWETEQIDNLFNQASFLIAKMLPTSFQRSSTMGTAGQWKLIMSAWSYENGLAIPETQSKRDFTGGLSRLLKVGYARNVVKLDYAALYPKTQLTWDIFPDLDISGVMKGMLTYVVDTRDRFKELTTIEKDKAKALVKILDKNKSTMSDDEIIKIKEQIAEHKSLSNLYDKKQLPLKILANSWFGSYGAPYIFNWGDTDSAEETTCRGRQALRLMVRHFTIKYGFKPLVGDTDGFNFSFPENIDEIKYVAKGNHWKTKKDAGKELVGLDAVLAEFNENYLEGRMGLDIDDVCNATINFARKNYANDIDGKIKLVGNSIKSKKMSVYIEDFLGKSIRMLLDGDGHSFINYYYEYVDKIYNYQIPLVKIATKSKVKSTISDYKKRASMKNKVGNPLPKQAHMELAIKDGLDITLGDVLYYINIGIGKSQGDIKSVDKNALTKKQKAVLIKNGEELPKPSIELQIFSKLIDPAIVDRDFEMIKELEMLKKALLQLTDDIESTQTITDRINEINESLFTDEYNVAKYLEGFNKKVKPLLVCFHPDIRNRILLGIEKTKDKVTKITTERLKERVIFTKGECELISGVPFKETDQDSYEELMTMEDKEIKFWDKVNKIPNYIVETEWNEIRADYHIRMAKAKADGIVYEKESLDDIFRHLEVSDLKNVMTKGELPLDVFIMADIASDGSGFLVSRKWGEILCHIDDIFKYEKKAYERHNYYKLTGSENLDDRYQNWLDYISEQRILTGDTITIDDVILEEKSTETVVELITEKANQVILIDEQPKKKKLYSEGEEDEDDELEMEEDEEGNLIRTDEILQLDDEFDDTYGEKPDGYVFIEEKPELKIEEEEWPF